MVVSPVLAVLAPEAPEAREPKAVAVGRVSLVVTYVEAGVGEEALEGGARLPWTRPARV